MSESVWSCLANRNKNGCKKTQTFSLFQDKLKLKMALTVEQSLGFSLTAVNGFVLTKQGSCFFFVKKKWWLLDLPELDKITPLKIDAEELHRVSSSPFLFETVSDSLQQRWRSAGSLHLLTVVARPSWWGTNLIVLLWWGEGAGLFNTPPISCWWASSFRVKDILREETSPVSVR